MKAEDTLARGLIFLSHSSGDKDVVEAIVKMMPSSHIFYDVKSMDPGENNAEQMEDGILDASVFAMFVSPNTKDSVWTQYEASVAAMQKAKRTTLKVVAIPIKGATYKNAPDWMHKYFATDEHYTFRDIARLLKQLFEKALRDSVDLPEELCIGREELVHKLVTHVRTAPLLSGVPINVVVLHGIQSMGRSTFCRRALPKLFPGLKSTYPIIDLPRQADAIDFYLALRSDAEGELNQSRLDELMGAWPKDDVPAMAQILHANLKHYEQINQPVVLRCARGIRDIGPNSGVRPWVEELFKLLQSSPNLKIIWISERSIPQREVPRFKNVFQYEVGELGSVLT